MSNITFLKPTPPGTVEICRYSLSLSLFLSLNLLSLFSNAFSGAFHVVNPVFLLVLAATHDVVLEFTFNGAEWFSNDEMRL
jgi:hypothetical protein